MLRHTHEIHAILGLLFCALEILGEGKKKRQTKNPIQKTKMMVNPPKDCSVQEAETSFTLCLEVPRKTVSNYFLLAKLCEWLLQENLVCPWFYTETEGI